MEVPLQEFSFKIVYVIRLLSMKHVTFLFSYVPETNTSFRGKVCDRKWKKETNDFNNYPDKQALLQNLILQNN